jgi:hypothetical protein
MTGKASHAFKIATLRGRYPDGTRINTRMSNTLKTKETRLLSVWIAATQRCVGCEGKKRESKKDAAQND